MHRGLKLPTTAGDKPIDCCMDYKRMYPKLYYSTVHSDPYSELQVQPRNAGIFSGPPRPTFRRFGFKLSRGLLMGSGLRVQYFKGLGLKGLGLQVMSLGFGVSRVMS